MLSASLNKTFLSQKVQPVAGKVGTYLQMTKQLSTQPSITSTAWGLMQVNAHSTVVLGILKVFNMMYLNMNKKSCM